jgi:crossover junction endodeoxyribonuclease RuvC
VSVDQLFFQGVSLQANAVYLYTNINSGLSGGKSMSLILGIDPGSRKTGFGIINHVNGKSEYVTSGIIRVQDLPLPERLKIIYDGVTELVETYSPGELSIEQVFMAKSAGSALKLGQARGAAIVACVARDMEVAEYSARQIKQSVVGSGAADKAQVQHMVKVLLKLPGEPAEDAADALAAALCHAHTQQSMIHIAGASSVARRRLR